MTWHAAVLAFCAAAPDLDLILRVFDGANHHRGASHSLAAAIIAGLCGEALRRRGAALPSGWAISWAWATHVLMDYLGVDTSPPFGEMALWPFSNGYFISPVSVFYDIPRSFSAAAIRHNAIAVAFELLVMVPIVALGWRIRSRA
jgi:inner membrane protein